MKHRRLLALAAAMVVLSACSSGENGASGVPSGKSTPVGESKTGEQLSGEGMPMADEFAKSEYFVSTNDTFFAFDADGLMIPAQKYETNHYCDGETGEPLYISRSFWQPVSGSYSDGTGVSRQMSALYDGSGNVLYDWDNVYYSQGTGKLLLKMQGLTDPADDSAYGVFSLWDPKSDTVVLSDVGSLCELGDGKFVVLSPEYDILGTIDADGNVIAGFPAPAVLSFSQVVEDGLFLGWSGETTYLMDENLNILISDNYIGTCNSFPRGYFYHSDGSSIEISSFDDPNTALFTTYGDPNDGLSVYFDGECFMQASTFGSPGPARLYDKDHNPLSSEYENVTAIYDSQEGKSPYFLLQGEGYLTKLGRDGKEIWRKEVPEDTMVGLEKGLIILTAPYSTYENNSIVGGSSVYDADLNPIIPEGKYETIYRAGNYSDYGEIEYYDYYIGYRPANYGKFTSYLIDILDLEGNVLIGGLNAVNTENGDKICCVRGFSVGVMDLSGQWISRYSVFSDISADD